MRKRVIKFYSNFEKEEVWLNKMAAQGWHLIDYVFGRYTFEKGKPGKYIYRLQFLEHHPTHIESADYLEFLEEAGVEVIASHVRWVYLRKKAEDGPFEIFSDRESRIAHYKKINMVLLPIAIVNLLFGVGLIGHARPINFLNLAAGAALCIPIFNHYRRILALQKESQIRE